VLHQAGYLLGVTYTNQALGDNASPASAEDIDKVPTGSKAFARAILQFQRVTQLKPDSAEHRHVIDLAWMALGRLFYETDNYRDAADAYGHVDQRSPEYATMLFELAWVYVRQKEFDQAERALEVLTVVSPETLEFADGSLLRADLMLRSKQFDAALSVYQSVRGRFEPIRSQVDTFLDSTRDPAVYYDRLVENRLGIDTQNSLPAVVMEWVREESEDDRVFALIDDVTRSRDLIRKSLRLAQKLSAVLGSSTRARAFPDIKLRLQGALGLTNQVTLAMRDLALGLESANDSRLTGRIAEVRAERRELMKRLGSLPITPGDFGRREAVGQHQWTKVSQELQVLTLEADKLQAIVNGLRRMLEDAERYGISVDVTEKARLQAEVEANELDLSVYRQRIEGYQEAVDRGRVQIGFGDKRYVDDKKVRDRFDALFREELALAAAGQAGPEAADYARKAQALLARADVVRGKLRQLSIGYENEVRERAQDLAELVRAEEAKVETYADRIDALDQHARLLVGEVAKRNFGLVRERLKSIVLRADVGIVQEAWEVRQSHLDRMQKLQRERATEEQYLNDELQEVLHQGGEEP
jgi:tetratricopeptide (TPR) repeat protein